VWWVHRALARGVVVSGRASSETTFLGTTDNSVEKQRQALSSQIGAHFVARGVTSRANDGSEVMPAREGETPMREAQPVSSRQAER
jgi:hypothetical protein